jgi:threonine synthase
VAEFTRESLQDAETDMWRYAPWLPRVAEKNIISMGEGWTPLIRLRSFPNVWLKDEGANPGGLWAARGASCAASVARESGWTEVALPRDDEAAAACAAYCAAAGVKAMAAEPPAECRVFGVTAGGGGEDIAEAFEAGCRTLAYELAEQFEWTPPAAVLVPHGFAAAALEAGFHHLVELGWIGQSPAVRTAAAVPMYSQIDRALSLAASEGLLVAPQTASCLDAVAADETAVVVNPVAGTRHLDVYARRFPAEAAATAKLGGLITPR